MQFKDQNMKQIVHCFLNGVAHNEKYPESVRSFCFDQYFLSVRAYESLRSHFKNNLPHPGTIRSWYANCDMNLRPGINEFCINVLKRKLEEQRAAGNELVVSVLFDEMHIRKLFQWCNKTKQMLGYPTIGISPEIYAGDLAANQVIVFMASGVNGSFQLPIAYHFIKSLNAQMRRDLVFDVVNVLIDAQIKVANIVFDGYPANRTMCELLGANFDIFSNNFKPYFVAKNGDPIMILLDVCHMEKLVRNALGSELIFYDDLDGKIEWKKYEQLVDYKNKGFAHTHKLNKNHINWQRRKMKVNLAVELLSASTADSMELLMNEGYEEFKDSAATIKFTRVFNDIFDCFNSKKNKPNANVFKNPLCADNKEQIFVTFNRAIEYIKGLKIIDQKGEKKLLVKSKLKTGFVGYIISMNSLIMIYNEFVVKNTILTSISTYDLNQDPLEIFFGKSRSLNGHNDNPSIQQFQSALRKLIVNDTICTSKRANCYDFNVASKPFSNILFVSSRRAKINTADIESDDDVTPEELETLHRKLSEIENRERNILIDPNLQDIATVYIANAIESRFTEPHRIKCELCKNVFAENKKINKAFNTSKFKSNPCESTFYICKEADRFLKFQLLTNDINFNTVYYAIFQQIDIEGLFTETDFSHDNIHKLYLIRGIVDAFIQIKGTYIAKTATFDIHQNQLRFKLKKLIHYYGQ